MEKIDQRTLLSELIRERREDYSKLSRLLGRNPAYIHQFITRGTPRELSERDRRTLADYFGIDEQELGAPGHVARHDVRKLVAIPLYDIGASAGSGSFVEDERPVAHFAFDHRWLMGTCASDPGCLSIIKVDGDSMVPTIANGEDIMVDRSEDGLRLNDGIYVLRRDDTLIVKRLSLHPVTKRVTISSDNAAYSSWPDCEPGSIEVVGRVIWAGRKIT